MITTIDLNCDMGEGMLNDAIVMPYLSSANIACGYHAGDTDTMKRTVALCLQHTVAIGAHPGFDDKANFGRTQMHLGQNELYDLVMKQLLAINSVCKEMNATLHHVKPHGAMYNMAAHDKTMSATIAKAVADFNPHLIYYGLSGSHMIGEAAALGLSTANEVFADRTYQADGSLTPRTEKNALIQDTEVCLQQVLQMILEKQVTTVDHTIISIYPKTLCLHGDGDHAAEFAKMIHNSLKKKGIRIEAV